MKILLALLISAYAFAEDGNKLFQTNCTVCHGSEGKGDGPAAGGMNPRPRNLVSDPLRKPTKEGIEDTIKNGLEGTQMPAFPYLTDTERAALADYVLSLRKK